LKQNVGQGDANAQLIIGGSRQCGQGILVDMATGVYLLDRSTHHENAID
jgi:hypothetical protein